MWLSSSFAGRSCRQRSTCACRSHPSLLAGAATGKASLHAACMYCCWQEALRIMETLHQEALRFKKSVLGEEPVGCADSLYGLARLYWSKGAYDEAEPLYQEALRVREPLHQEAFRIKAIHSRPPQVLFRVGGRDGMGVGVSLCGATGAFRKRNQAIPLTDSPGALLRAGSVIRFYQEQTWSGHRGGWPVNPIEPPQALYGVGCGMGWAQGRT